MKTYQEIAESSRRSIKELQEHNENSLFDECQLVADLIVYHTLIAEACEKQVAKPIEYAGRCLTCDEIWYGYNDGYCTNCGQKLEDVNCRREVQP